MSEIQRYKPPMVIHDSIERYADKMVYDDSGDYVLHAGHIAKVAEMQAEIDKWKQYQYGAFLTNQECRRIQDENASLREKLARLQWRPITPEDLPKVGDEVWSATQNEYIPHDDMLLRNGVYEVIESTEHVEYYKKLQFTHFRKINAPEAK